MLAMDLPPLAITVQLMHCDNAAGRSAILPPSIVWDTILLLYGMRNTAVQAYTEVTSKSV